jgi:serine/threonine protein kinase/beta-lactam-binding protein with PASTA domain
MIDSAKWANNRKIVAMDDTLADPLVGRLLDGRYAVTARIAHGGMATVYRAVDTRLDREVALKVMHAELARDDDFVRRFIGEAKSVARLSHQNVVAVFDQGADGPFLYLAMEYVPGRTLKEMLRDHGRLLPAVALEIMTGVLDGLAAAHASGIVHRDVKPENVLLTADGRVKVADFGLARAHAAAGHTRTGLLIGTVAYVPPEQVTGESTGPRGDVYSAGVMLFEMLTGQLPFKGDTPLSVAYQHVNHDVPAPSALVPDIPMAVDQLVLAATSRDPVRRPADAAEFLRAVRRVRERLKESSGLTGVIGVGVQGLGDAPWLDLDTPAATNGWWARTGSLPATSVHATGQSPVTAAAISPPAPDLPGTGLSGTGLSGTGLSGTGLSGTGLSGGGLPGTDSWWDQGKAAAGESRTAQVGTQQFGSGFGSDQSAAAQFGTGQFGTGQFGTGQFRTGGRDDAGSHTLIVNRDDGGRYPGVREPFLQRWLFSPRLLIVVLILTLGAGFGFGGWWLTAGRYAQVPTVAGDSVKLATAALTTDGFTVKKSEQVHSNTVPKGTALGTTPSGRVSKGTAVSILVSAGPFTSVVPKVADDTLAAAQAALQRVHLSTTTQKVASNSPVGTVIGTNPPAGTSWPQTKPVTILIATSQPLPNFVGQNVQAAQAWGAENGVTIQVQTDTTSQEAQGTVTQQQPAAGSAFSRGETVIVFVSQGPQLVNVPDVTGETVTQATQQLQQAGFKVQVQGPPFRGTVWGYSPVTPQPAGSTITLNVNATGTFSFP